MKRLFSFFLALLLLVPSFAFASTSENVVSYEISLELPYGSRSGLYTGSLVDGSPDGHGVFESQNAAGEYWVYVGNFSDGIFHGNGYSFWESGQVEKGEYEQGTLVAGTVIQPSQNPQAFVDTPAHNDASISSSEKDSPVNAVEPAAEVEVWAPKSGKKYHSSSTCSNMKNPSQITLSAAKSKGLTPCSKCNPPK